MATRNFSQTTCTLNKNEGDQVVDLNIVNQSAELSKTMSLKATDKTSGALLTIYVDGASIDTITVEPKSTKTIQIDVSKVDDLIDLELTRNSGGGGVSIRQSNSNNEHGRKNVMEIVLR
jgi:hypothetical protein